MSRVALLGGDNRDSELTEKYRSYKATNAGQKALIQAIRTGSVSKVICCARGVPHKFEWAVKKACKQRGIPYISRLTSNKSY